jgi:futalosine hydrolase
VNTLVVVAVEAERAAIVTAGASVQVVAGGVGPAAAAAATATALARDGQIELVLSAGIAGGFSPLAPGAIAVASTSVFADLGAQTPAGFATASALGFGQDTYAVEPRLAVELSDRTGGHLGTIITVSTVTGSVQRATELVARYPDAVAEAMEGAGVAAAAALHGVAFAEVRAISNAVGPRERDAWEIPLALDALGRAVAAATR